MERNLKKAGLITKKKGPASKHRKLQRSSKRSKKLSKNAIRIIDTSANLVEGYVNKKLYFSSFIEFFSLKSLQSFLLILNSKSKWSKVLLKSNLLFFHLSYDFVHKIFPKIFTGQLRIFLNISWKHEWMLHKNILFIVWWGTHVTILFFNFPKSNCQ